MPIWRIVALRSVSVGLIGLMLSAVSAGAAEARHSTGRGAVLVVKARRGAGSGSRSRSHRGRGMSSYGRSMSRYGNSGLGNNLYNMYGITPTPYGSPAVSLMPF